MIYIITFFIFIIGVLLCFMEKESPKGNKYKSFKKIIEIITNEKLNNYLTGIMTTILGVTLAIIFTNNDVKNQEKVQTQEFLDVVYTELDTKSEFITTMMDEIENDDIDAEAIYSTMKIMPISPVLSLDVLLTDAPYTATVSSYSYSSLLSCRINFIMQQKRIEEHTDIGKVKLDLLIMSNELERACKIVEIELQYQEGKINKEEVGNKIDEIMFTPIIEE